MTTYALSYFMLMSKRQIYLLKYLGYGFLSRWLSIFWHHLFLFYLSFFLSSSNHFESFIVFSMLIVCIISIHTITTTSISDFSVYTAIKTMDAFKSAIVCKIDVFSWRADLLGRIIVYKHNHLFTMHLFERSDFKGISLF